MSVKWTRMYNAKQLRRFTTRIVHSGSFKIKREEYWINNKKKMGTDDVLLKALSFIYIFCFGYVFTLTAHTFYDFFFFYNNYNMHLVSIFI